MVLVVLEFSAFVEFVVVPLLALPFGIAGISAGGPPSGGVPISVGGVPPFIAPSPPKLPRPPPKPPPPGPSSTLAGAFALPPAVTMLYVPPSVTSAVSA
ncbi:hypothetical protein D3C75_1240810 [compost metagenome]